MHRDNRLRASSDFQRVRNVGKSVANPSFVLVWAPNPEGRLRFGIAVGKKIGGAVTRNKIKRRVREHLRQQVRAAALKRGVDVLIIARAAARDADYQTVTQALDDLLGRARLWKGGR